MKAVNLLPPDLRGAPASVSGDKPPRETPPGVGAYVVLGALAIAVAALAVYVLAGNAVKDREAKLATVKTEAQNAQERVAALKPYADFEALANQRFATVHSLAEARFDWNRALEDLARALPKDAALMEVSGDVTPTAGGGGGNSLRSALPAPALSLKGCVSSQTGVAKVMSRLGNIQGVTRVTLATSDKDSTSAVTPSAGQAQTGPYCGKGTPPTFDVVVFFERDTERVAAAPGLVDPAATGTPTAATAANDAGKKAGSESSATGSTSNATQGGGSK